MSEVDIVDPKIIVTAPRPDKWLGTRHLQIILLCLGVVCSFTQNVSLSVSIVAMVDKQTANPDFPDYGWDEGTKGIILSSFFWGYVITQIPGGQLAQRFGPKPLLAICLGVSSLFSILTPGAVAWGGWGLVVAFRVIQGLAQGLLFPAAHALLSKWAPTTERGMLVASVYAGGPLGTMVSLPFCGLLATSAAGWPSTFYVFGGLGLVWTLLWIIVGSNSPALSRLISVEERAYIEDSLRTSDKPNQPLPTPWRALLTSLPMWAIIVASCGNNWGFWTLMIEMPSYMNSVLGFDLRANGVLSAVPYFAAFLMSFVFSRISDHVTNNKILSKTAARKLFSCIGMFVPALLLIGLAYANEKTLCMLLLTTSVGINSAVFVGFFVNIMDLAPNYVATMIGLTNGLANVMGIIGTLVVGIIVTDSSSASQWRIVFFITSTIYVCAAIFYLAFGSAELQWWNDHERPPPVKVFTITTEKYSVKNMNS